MEKKERNKNLKVFSKENQPAKRGRPKRGFNLAKEFDNKLTRDDYFWILRGLIEKTNDELIRLSKDEKALYYVRMLADALITDYKKHNPYTLNTILDRLIGKAGQSIELTGKDGKDLVREPLTIEIVRTYVGSKD